MSNISLVEAKLPPGFRFHPRDEELVCDYLLNKITDSDSTLMIEVDLNKCEPWDIPGGEALFAAFVEWFRLEALKYGANSHFLLSIHKTACVGGKEWYFYSQRDRKYATGLRTNRATASGYWKATGKDRPVHLKGTLVGMRKTLVFYQGRAPKGKKTDWVMHEFRLEAPLATPKLISSDKVYLFSYINFHFLFIYLFFRFFHEDWVLCRVFYKSREIGPKPSLGSCYGETTGSKCLPPLMDSYISFDHSRAAHQNYIDYHDQYEQVPCFSNIFPYNNNQIINDPILKNLQAHIDYSNIPNKLAGTTLSSSTNTTGIIPNNDGDNEVLKAVLSHFTKMESNIGQSLKGSPSLGEGSSESYLSEVQSKVVPLHVEPSFATSLRNSLPSGSLNNNHEDSNTTTAFHGSTFKTNTLSHAATMAAPTHGPSSIAVPLSQLPTVASRRSFSILVPPS
ncbi:hypothetical protein FEM48_Zijuj07G0140700 [Ziziphus jujuba var. spinosa]|uniref:NAC domain-containing protein n=1 Tax=Ziziphus jujuba var. spinosa TaxID=714518 RepID=A0A978V524_ZIZJJ|nr:hypothetical protein FEM48_Zijuj07G0140700 [Ziziphus jujuba var. spinosa]